MGPFQKVIQANERAKIPVGSGVERKDFRRGDISFTIQNFSLGDSNPFLTEENRIFLRRVNLLRSILQDAMAGLADDVFVENKWRLQFSDRSAAIFAFVHGFALVSPPGGVDGWCMIRIGFPSL